MLGDRLRIEVPRTELGAAVFDVDDPEIFQVGLDEGEAIAGVDGHDFDAIVEEAIYEAFTFVVQLWFLAVFAGSGIGENQHAFRVFAQAVLVDPKSRSKGVEGGNRGRMDREVGVEAGEALGNLAEGGIAQTVVGNKMDKTGGCHGIFPPNEKSSISDFPYSLVVDC